MDLVKPRICYMVNRSNKANKRFHYDQLLYQPVFSLIGEDEPYEAENRPEAKGGSEHLRNVDYVQRN